MKFRFVSTTLLSLLLLTLVLPSLATAATPGSIIGLPLFFNGNELKPEVAPRIIKDVAMVPVRIIAEELGSKVEWNQAARKVRITKDSMQMEMVIDQLTATVNGTNHTLDSAPVLVSGNTLLPIRFIAENMGIEVNWNELNRSVYLNEKSVVVEKSVPATGAVLPPLGQTDNSANKPSTNNPVIADANGKPLPVIKTIDLTSSQLSIKADSGELRPGAFYLHGPDRIVVDIPNAVLDPALYKDPAAKSGDTVSKNVYFSNVRYSQYNTNPYAVRIVLEMKDPVDLSWASGWNSAALTGVFQKAAKYKVVLDPGHGDHDPGAKAVNGLTEKDFNLSLGLKVYNLLQKVTQIQPYLTRDDDTFVRLDDRAQFANDLNADIFVSIHANSYVSTTPTGTETYYYKSDSGHFAQIMHKHLSAATGLPDRGVRSGPFRVIRITNMPAVLLEVGYLSNDRDAALMLDEAFQNKVADAIAAGIKEQLTIQ